MPFRFTTTLICLLVTSFLVGCGQACPDSGDLWFLEQRTIIPTALPVGIDVRDIAEQSDRAYFLEIRNDTTQPLYVLGVPNPHFPTTMHGSDLPFAAPDSAPIFQIRANQVLLAVGIDANGRTQWSAYGGSTPEQSSLRIPIESIDEFFPGYQRFFQAGDDRPTTITPPADQQYILTLYYDTEPIEIPLLQTYRLNPRYNPVAAQEARRECTGRIGAGLLPYCCCIPAFLVCAVLLVIAVIPRR